MGLCRQDGSECFALAFGCNNKLSAMSGHSEVPEYRLRFGPHMFLYSVCRQPQFELEVEHVEMNRDLGCRRATFVSDFSHSGSSNVLRPLPRQLVMSQR